MSSLTYLWKSRLEYFLPYPSIVLQTIRHETPFISQTRDESFKTLSVSEVAFGGLHRSRAKTVGIEPSQRVGDRVHWDNTRDNSGYVFDAGFATILSNGLMRSLLREGSGG